MHRRAGRDLDGDLAGDRLVQELRPRIGAGEIFFDSACEWTLDGKARVAIGVYGTEDNVCAAMPLDPPCFLPVLDQTPDEIRYWLSRGKVWNSVPAVGLRPTKGQVAP